MSDNTPQPRPVKDDEAFPRRDFLKLAWGTLGTAAIGGAGFAGLRYFSSQVDTTRFGQEITLETLDTYPVGSVTMFNEGRFYLVHFEDGGLIALYYKCTHLDCVVLWDEEQGRFQCPCHGSVFEPDGAVLNLPAPRPLVRFPVSIDDRGRVVVDTGAPINRETTGPEDIFYPPPPAEGDDSEEAGT